jgi:hypothetical protein
MTPVKGDTSQWTKAEAMSAVSHLLYYAKVRLSRESESLSGDSQVISMTEMIDITLSRLDLLRRLILLTGIDRARSVSIPQSPNYTRDTNNIPQRRQERIAPQAALQSRSQRAERCGQITSTARRTDRRRSHGRGHRSRQQVQRGARACLGCVGSVIAENGQIRTSQRKVQVLAQ